MPGMIVTNGTVKKRKREDLISEHKAIANKARKAPKIVNVIDKVDKDNAENIQEQILLLESQTLESRKGYNNILTLHQYIVKPKSTSNQTAVTAAVSLCRIFCRLIAGGTLVKRKSETASETEIRTWLKQRLRDYSLCLSHPPWIGGPDGTRESTALTLLMRIVKAEVSLGGTKAENAWRNSSDIFRVLVEALIMQKDAELARGEFVDKFVEEFDDVRFYTFMAVTDIILAKKSSDENETRCIDGAIDVLVAVERIPSKQDELQNWYSDNPTDPTHQLHSLTVHRKTSQDTWLTIFRSLLSQAQRKRLLSIMTRQILPWFTTRLESLADFLTSSFSAGGSLSLLSLSGIFHLITHRNLDYPDFYTKLYSLLDDHVLQSKHRSRFFRHLSLFLSSTHLPAALVASFLKRLARLALQAPPGAIVFIVPWVYNMLRSHPTCTFMLHRPPHPAHMIYATSKKSPESEGVEDTFSMSETDPNITNAIESSLWELETLMSHYHPNVATLAKILNEQFTKREYVLEDFLDHSYGSLVEGELGRALKADVEIEWEIPKRIVTAEQSGDEGESLNGIGRLMERARGALVVA